MIEESAVYIYWYNTFMGCRIWRSLSSGKAPMMRKKTGAFVGTEKKKKKKYGRLSCADQQYGIHSGAVSCGADDLLIA